MADVVSGEETQVSDLSAGEEAGTGPAPLIPTKPVCSASYMVSPPLDRRALGLGEVSVEKWLTGLCRLSSLLERMSHFTMVDTPVSKQMVHFFAGK